MNNVLPRFIRDPLFAVGYAIVFYALFQTAHLFWYLPAGFRFAVLMLSPLRRWPWFVATEVLIFVTIYAQVPEVAGRSALAFASIVSGTLMATLGPLLLWRTRSSSPLDSPASMAQLLAAMAVAAIAATFGNVFFPFTELAWLSPLRLILKMTLGDYVGILVLAPLVLMVVRERPSSAIVRCWRFDIPCVLLPVLLLYFVLVAHSGEAQVFFFSALLCLLPSIYFAVRSGWRGAALALAGASVAVAYSGVFVGNAELTSEAQGFLAVAGSANLLLGAAYDALRGNETALQERNAGLLAANEQTTRIAGDLRDAARRNLSLSEDTRRWITSELHDEIGQNLTALQTRVRLLERRSGQEGSELAVEITQILTIMRHSVSGLMSDLRPSGLDEFGLVDALEQGTILSLLQSNGIACDVRIDDEAACLECLDNDALTTIYRIVQEAAMNTVRHADAQRFRVCLRTRNAMDGNYRVLLVIDDDGCGFASNRRADGIGLLGIRDRVLALGGRLRLRSGVYGTRLQVRIRLDDAGKDTT
jgi:glucose-6-phosphate-specific signal transduction histidine kinase